MSIFDRLTGTRDTEEETDESEVDYWAVRHMPFDGTGGFRSLEDWERLEDPIDLEEFKWNHPDPDPGLYRLYAVRDSKYTRPPEKFRWKWEVENEPNKSPHTTESVGEIETEIQGLREDINELQETNGPDQPDPELINTQLRAALMRAALNSPEFMAIHGDRIALRAFEWLFEQSNGLEYEEFAESPSGALMYSFTKTALDDPEKVREVGTNIGAGVQGILDGMAGMEPTDGLGREMNVTNDYPKGSPHQTIEMDAVGKMGLDTDQSTVTSTIDDLHQKHTAFGSTINDTGSNETSSSEGQPVTDTDSGFLLDDELGFTGSEGIVDED